MLSVFRDTSFGVSTCNLPRHRGSGKRKRRCAWPVRFLVELEWKTVDIITQSSCGRCCICTVGGRSTGQYLGSGQALWNLHFDLMIRADAFWETAPILSCDVCPRSTASTINNRHLGPGRKLTTTKEVERERENCETVIILCYATPEGIASSHEYPLAVSQIPLHKKKAGEGVESKLLCCFTGTLQDACSCVADD